MTPNLKSVLLRSHHAHFVLVSTDAHVSVIVTELTTWNTGVTTLRVAHKEAAAHLTLPSLKTERKTRN